MNESYINAFRSIIEDTKTETGMELPYHIELYVTILLADFLDKPNFIPDQSFAETFLKIKNSKSAKELGDTCLFLTGVFPQYGSRYNLNITYYSEIGSASYSRACTSLNRETFETLSNHFDYVRQFIQVTTNSRTSIIN